MKRAAGLSRQSMAYLDHVNGCRLMSTNIALLHIWRLMITDYVSKDHVSITELRGPFERSLARVVDVYMVKWLLEPFQLFRTCFQFASVVCTKRVSAIKFSVIPPLFRRLSFPAEFRKWRRTALFDFLGLSAAVTPVKKHFESVLTSQTKSNLFGFESLRSTWKPDLNLYVDFWQVNYPKKLW